MPLTDIMVRHAKPRDKSYKMADMLGLYIQVLPSGTKLWKMKYRLDGREKKLSFGEYPRVSLRDARRRRDEARESISNGTDPAYEKKRARLRAKVLAEDTRRQRANYIIKAGLPDDFVKDVLKFDVKAHADELIEMVNELNKATHVRPDTILTDGAMIRRMFMDVVSGLDGLLDAAEDSRKAVQDEVGTAMHNAVFEKLIGEAIQELDELSTHTAIDHHWIDEIVVEEMDAKTISYLVQGTVAVELQYGSGSDVASGIGFRTTDNYPYEAEVEVAINNPLKVDVSDIELKVDSSSFYE